MTTSLCLFYGNCQMVEMANIFNKIQHQYMVIKISPVHKLFEHEIKFIYDILPKLELFITQPISDFYKNNVKLSTKKILQQLHPKCRIIFIPVCYFDFYYPQVIYLKTQKSGFHEFYFDKNIINLYQQNYNIDEIITKYTEITSNPDYVFPNNFNATIKNLKTREHDILIKYGKYGDIINISDFIQNNYQDKLLFYTRNHIAFPMFEFIFSQITKILHIHISSFDDDPFKFKHPKMYMALQQYVNFDITQYEETQFGKTGIDVVKEWIHLLNMKIFLLKN